MSQSRKPIRTLLAAALALAAIPALAQDSPFSETYFFGDSMTDTGHFRPVLIQMLGPDGALLGRFTNNPGLVWAEYLADYYGTDASSDNQGGTNYAVGGARAGVDTGNALGAVPSVASQVGAYLAASGGRADPDALYSVWAGANDLFAVQADPAQAQQIIGGAIAAEVGVVGALQQAGARYVLVANMPDIGLTPAARAGGAAGMGQGTALAAAYNDALFDTLASQGLSVIPVDTFHFLQEVVANPGAYGLSNVTTPGCGVQPAPAGGSALFCNPGSHVSPEVARTWLFADGVHPSAAAHAMMGQLAVSMIEGPRQMALLPHVEAVVGRARAGRVDARLASQPQGEGWRWWADVRADSLRYGNGDSFDGVAPALTFGIDRASGNLVYGGFAGYGRQDSNWGLRRGSFELSDATLGGYLGWRAGQAWANGQLSYTRLGLDTEREVQLGQATRSHAGSADGSNVGAGASAGWDFGDGAFVHGPVLSVLAQQITIDGFAESDPALSTSLAYPEQDVDSLIGSVGWQFRWAPAERIHPYGKITWDREFEDAPEQAFASARSIPGSLPYAVPGHAFDERYGTFVIGARTHVMGMDADVGATTTFGHEGGNDATVFMTVGNRF